MLEERGSADEVAVEAPESKMIQKIRDIAPFGLRISPELKAALEHEARANQRSLNFEINRRLEESLTVTKPRPTPPSGKEVKPAPHIAQSDAERAVLAMFRHLPHEKQLALLSLLK